MAGIDFADDRLRAVLLCARRVVEGWRHPKITSGHVLYASLEQDEIVEYRAGTVGLIASEMSAWLRAAYEPTQRSSNNVLECDLALKDAIAELDGVHTGQAPIGLDQLLLTLLTQDRELATAVEACGVKVDELATALSNRSLEPIRPQAQVVIAHGSPTAGVISRNEALIEIARREE